jgi:hypothetical protein
MYFSAGILEQFLGSRNRVRNELSYRPVSLCRLAGWYDNLIPPRFLAPIDYSKIPAQYSILLSIEKRGLESCIVIQGVWRAYTR